MKKSLFLSILFLSSAVPFLVSAQSKITDLGNSIKAINSNIITATATLFMALAMAAFFFGIAKFILASRDGDTTQIKNGKEFMLWSVIALFVMFSIYGIIRFVQENTIGTNNMNIVLPTFQIGGGSNTNTQDGLGGGANNAGNNGLGGGANNGGGSGSCIPNTVCYDCGQAQCICNGSSVCVYDYANPNTPVFMQSACTNSGGSWDRDAGCDCPNGRTFEAVTGQCVSDNSGNNNYIPGGNGE